jgi:hypothetical protein
MRESLRVIRHKKGGVIISGHENWPAPDLVGPFKQKTDRIFRLARFQIPVRALTKIAGEQHRFQPAKVHQIDWSAESSQAASYIQTAVMLCL